MDYPFFRRRGEKLTPRYVLEHIAIVTGLVLVWRGIWYILDGLDLILFNGDHLITGVFGVIIGLAILYLPDRDLKEIRKL